MLQSMHDRYKGWIAWIIVALIAITFAFWGVESIFQNNRPSGAVANVNGALISKKDWDRVFGQLHAQATQHFGQMVLQPTFIQELKQSALNELLTTRLLASNALKSGYWISANQAGAQIVKIPYFREQDAFSEQRYQMVLARMDYTPATFLTAVKEDMLISQLQRGVLSTAFATPHEIDEMLSLFEQTRDVGVFILSKKTVEHLKHDNVEEQKRYYEQHVQDFMNPAKVKVRYVLVSFDDVLAKQEVSEEQIQEYYDTNISLYEHPEERLVAHILLKPRSDKATASSEVDGALQKIQALKARVNHKEKFSTLAKRYSEDVVSAKNGGVLPWLTRGTFKDPNFETAAFSLHQPGEVSNPVQSRYGWHLVQLLAIRPAERKPFENAKASIKVHLAQQQAQKDFANLSETLADLSFSSPNSLEAIVETYSVKEKQSDWLEEVGVEVDAKEQQPSRDQSASFLKKPEVIRAAFSDAVRQGNNSNVIPLNDKQVLVLRLEAYQKPTPKSFSEVQPEIEKILTRRVQTNALRASAEKIVQSEKRNASSGSDSVQQSAWKLFEKVKRDDKRLSQESLRRLFAMSKNPKVLEKSDLEIVELPGGDLQLLKLIQIRKPGDPHQDAKKREFVKRALTVESGDIEVKTYTESLLSKAKIKTYIDLNASE